ncbi:Gfo/Idh/MocA family oxidoreductase [Rhodobacter sp. KR11]|uniref:Gfo/Idh/MocA family protein n=1 Tax=Rhodobacter sp. KR11 TaxID=2974588 RepID=UPI0022218270|nr:Gfo/Idh/MocA family oxidoreductase [Rhodobacter sp. KR11]MCW1918136.1 Gfo/Idh/MocA family oxidoreductase [Rhodobacter sp. KR11]
MHTVTLGEKMEQLRIGVIGAGGKAVDYAASWAKMPDLRFVAVADVSAQACARLAAVSGGSPRAYADYRQMLTECRKDLDMVYVSTPHVLHGEQALAVTEAGLDLFLEKPMVTTVAEAKALIAAQNRIGNLIVVAFNGGLSPLVRDTRARIEAGEFGALVSVSGSIWEGWKDAYNGGWKQDPAISGGGFMFDTGAHMMNTICQLLDADFDRVSAYMNNRGKPVDITCAVSARTKSGVLVTLNAAGEGPKGCFSHMTLFFQNALVRIDAWGGSREISYGNGVWTREEDEITDNPMRTFLAVRRGAIPNPSTIQNGLRFARLWDAIKLSASRDGESVRVDE